MHLFIFHMEQLKSWLNFQKIYEFLKRIKMPDKLQGKLSLIFQDIFYFTQIKEQVHVFKCPCYKSCHKHFIFRIRKRI